jgi:hypothetical protein
MTIWCFNCGQRYTTKLPSSGKRAKCVKCGAILEIPADDSRPDAPSGAARDDAAAAADPLRSFFEQELAAFDTASPALASVPPPQTRRPTVKVEWRNVGWGLFHGLRTFVFRKPLSASWMAILIALLGCLLLWLAGLWRLWTPWGHLCQLTAAIIGIGTLVWIFRKPRFKVSWEHYFIVTPLVLGSVLVPQVLMKDMSREAKGIAQIAVSLPFLCYALYSFSNLSPALLRKTLQCFFLCLAVGVLYIVGGILAISSQIPAMHEMLAARHQP